MPELFPTVIVLVLCSLIMAGGQLIYATVGFGAGMFSISLLALVLPDLAGAVATLLVLTLITEVSVLAQAWRHAQIRLLVGLLPTTIVGMWIGTGWLATSDPTPLKRLLGLVVLSAGTWFLYREFRPGRATGAGDHACHAPSSVRIGKRGWWAAPAGLVAGVLGGLFGTGGPPVIVLLRSYHLDKSTFRATILWYFLCMSAIRAGMYVQAELLTVEELRASLWLLPASLAGMVMGMLIHRCLSERAFGIVVAVLLMGLGLTLVVSGGR